MIFACENLSEFRLFLFSLFLGLCGTALGCLVLLVVVWVMR